MATEPLQVDVSGSGNDKTWQDLSPPELTQTQLFDYTEPLRRDELIVQSAEWDGRTIRRTVCPHCWARIHLGDLLWVAAHPSLRGDPVAGEDVMRRFLPSQYDVHGNAIDARGSVCHDLACPACRLLIPRALLQSRQLYFSLVGVPASGKTYLTAAMTWRLRSLLPDRFGWGYQDVDPVGNASLIENEQTLFLRSRPDDPISLDKTEMQGAHYDFVRFGQHQVSLARPFQFLLTAPKGHRKADGSSSGENYGHVLNFYDNAGEHFIPGNDTTLTPGTQHVAHANVLMFLFDPMQDARCRAVMKKASRDPQLGEGFAHEVRQDTILNEMARRVRRYSHLSESQRLEQPLMILVSKADAWRELAGVAWGDADEPVFREGDGSWAVDTRLIDRASQKTRAWMKSVVPEFVSLAESMHRHVVYVPVSALGGPPESVGQEARLMIRPTQIAPKWVTAPVLYSLAKWSRQMLPGDPDQAAPGERERG
ncbi:hypothetical protein [Mucisphaera sp.]|uniref:hypothetical protein n=1 Tax=Mucisphaera sp. TaxID=2913024 RepID=UPI003D13D70A